MATRCTCLTRYNPPPPSPLLNYTVFILISHQCLCLVACCLFLWICLMTPCVIQSYNVWSSYWHFSLRGIDKNPSIRFHLRAEASSSPTTLVLFGLSLLAFSSMLLQAFSSQIPDPAQCTSSVVEEILKVLYLCKSK